jgi:hypothetical protein
MDKRKDFKLDKITNRDLSINDLKGIRAGSKPKVCIDMNCQCTNATFTDGFSNAYLDANSSAGEF